MKLLNQIKAFFKVKNEELEMDVKAAEIREGRAYLHPKDNEFVTYVVPSDDITIILNNSSSLKETDIKVIERTKQDTDINKVQEDNKKIEDILPKGSKEINEEMMKKLFENQKQNKNHTKKKIEKPRVYFDMEQFKKKSFTIKVYPDEYDAIVSAIKEYGFRREEFVLACISKANKRTVVSECKKIEQVHIQKKQEEESLKNKQVNESENELNSKTSE